MNKSSRSLRALAVDVGVAASTLHAWSRRGCPVDQGAEAVKAWRLSHTRPDARTGPRRALQRTADEALVVLSALTAAGAARLTAGQPLGDLEAPIRAALRAVPMDRRAEVAIPANVFDALCREVVAAVERSLGGPDAMAQERQRYEAGSHAEAERMGELWYAIACGEMVLDPGARP